MTGKEKVFKVLTPEADDLGFERVVNVALATLIAANALAVIVETVEPLYQQYRLFFVCFEIVSVSVFALEYLLRLWACTVHERYRHPLWGRLRYMASPLALVDFAAILPSVLSLHGLDLRFARTVRLLRLFRALRLARYSPALQAFARVAQQRAPELGVAALGAGILLVCSASALYFAEHDAQPQAFASIPAAMWWAVTTLTTVGYGDIYPVTVPGRLLASVIAMLGVSLFAIPAGILSAGFTEELRRRREEEPCPHCGRTRNG